MQVASKQTLSGLLEEAARIVPFASAGRSSFWSCSSTGLKVPRSLSPLSSLRCHIITGFSLEVYLFMQAGYFRIYTYFKKTYFSSCHVPHSMCTWPPTWATVGLLHNFLLRTLLLVVSREHGIYYNYLVHFSSPILLLLLPFCKA